MKLVSDTAFKLECLEFCDWLRKMVSDTLFSSCPHSSVVEHFLGKEEVTGSSPVVGSMEL